MNTELHASLTDFACRVNEHPRLRSLLKGWDRVAGVTASDTGAEYTLVFAGSQLVAVETSAPRNEPDIVMRASEQVLERVFSGKSNPATLFLEGSLQVFATDRDQVKLDAIALVLWD
jgi:putative sterol carrier protein